MITVVKPGLLSTVQDEGRRGYRAFGMPWAGALDQDAYVAANLLAGNGGGEAVVEMTLLGGTFRFDVDAVVGIAGADMQPTVDGAPVAGWSSFRVAAGSVLAFSSAREGCRCYLAVRGGIDVPVVLGSRSTYTRARIGGVEGRALAAGDVVRIAAAARHTASGAARRGRFASASKRPLAADERKIPEDLVPCYPREKKIRVVLGPQDDRFLAEGVETFLGEPYTVSNRNDRMGYQLDGPVIRHARGPDIVSDAVMPGSIQVPGNGLPLLLMQDCATVGGYTKLATAIRADLSRMAQSRTGDTVWFQACTFEEAVEALRRRDAWIGELTAALGR